MSASAQFVSEVSRTEGGLHEVYGTVTISPDPAVYLTGGIPLNFGGIRATRPPIRVVVEGRSGYSFRYAKGTTASNGKILVFTGSAAQSPMAQLSNNTTIPAALSGDTISIIAIFKGQL